MSEERGNEEEKDPKNGKNMRNAMEKKNRETGKIEGCESLHIDNVQKCYLECRLFIQEHIKIRFLLRLNIGHFRPIECFPQC